MQCPECANKKTVKDGKISKKQRFFCRPCQFHFTGHHEKTRKILQKCALQLYLGGLGLRAIGRILGKSNVTILKWI